MAKAKINYKEAKVVIQQFPDTVTLELTMYEASVLRDLLGKRVIGTGKARDIGTTEIFYALQAAGIEPVGGEGYFSGNVVVR